MEKYDFIHYFLINSPIFNNAIIDLLSYKKMNHSHLFVCQHKNNFDRISNKSNAVYDPSICDINHINNYLCQSKYVVFHSLEYTKKEINSLGIENPKRIIWCIWGHDLYKIPTSKIYVKNIIHNCLCWGYWNILKRKDYHSFRNQIKQFRAIFYGFEQDRLYIQNKFSKSIVFYNALYPSGYYLQDINVKNNNKIENNNRVHILLGHNASPYLNHIRNLKRLQKYKNHIDIHMPLSYGQAGYAQYVINESKKYFDEDSLHFYTDFMDSKTYIDLLSKIDLAIFDFKHQAAFGNIILLLYLGKKIYLDKHGVMSKGLSSEGLSVFDVNDIGKESLDELKSDFSKDNNVNYAYNRLNKEYIFNQWKNAFDDILLKDMKENE